MAKNGLINGKKTTKEWKGRKNDERVSLRDKLLLLPRNRKDGLNQMKGNTERIGGSRKYRKYFLKC